MRDKAIKVYYDWLKEQAPDVYSDPANLPIMRLRSSTHLESTSGDVLILESTEDDSIAIVITYFENSELNSMIQLFDLMTTVIKEVK